MAAPDTSSYILASPASGGITNAVVLSAVFSQFFLADDGQNFQILPDGYAAGISNLDTTGYVARILGSSEGASIVTRTLSTDNTLNIDESIPGQVRLSVNPNTNLQKIALSVNGGSSILASKLRFIDTDRGFKNTISLSPINPEIVDINIGLAIGDAPNDATYILQEADSDLPNAQSLEAFNAILRSTTGTGVIGNAIEGLHYQYPSVNLTDISAFTVSKGGMIAGANTSDHFLLQLADAPAGSAYVSDGAHGRWTPGIGRGTVTSITTTSSDVSIEMTGSPLETAGTIDFTLPVRFSSSETLTYPKSLPVDAYGLVRGDANRVNGNGMAFINDAIPGTDPSTEIFPGFSYNKMSAFGLSPATFAGYLNQSHPLTLGATYQIIAQNTDNLASRILLNLNSPLTLGRVVFYRAMTGSNQIDINGTGSCSLLLSCVYIQTPGTVGGEVFQVIDARGTVLLT